MKTGTSIPSFWKRRRSIILLLSLLLCGLAWWWRVPPTLEFQRIKEGSAVFKLTNRSWLPIYISGGAGLQQLSDAGKWVDVEPPPNLICSMSPFSALSPLQSVEFTEGLWDSKARTSIPLTSGQTLRARTSVLRRGAAFSADLQPWLPFSLPQLGEPVYFLETKFVVP